MCLRRGYIAQLSGASSEGPIRQNHRPVAPLMTAVPVPVRQVGSASHRLLSKLKITRGLLASGWLCIGNLITAFAEFQVQAVLWLWLCWLLNYATL